MPSSTAQTHETGNEGFVASRAAALSRLANFLPFAGQRYATTRNFDHGVGERTNVSGLSPYLRSRMITEREVISAVLSRHSYADAEKFVQEVLWRTYWKGWLEMRPQVWRSYVEECATHAAILTGSRELAEAEAGRTGIDGFDDWARELVQTGYLHNHVRMWFASIWIFTLRLPWSLGASFFERHLLDADPASNTLSWRWVAGLQTVGKTYLASTENIRRYTDGRHAPRGLASVAVPLTEPPPRPAAPLNLPPPHDDGSASPAILIVTPEDLHPESIFSPGGEVRHILLLSQMDRKSDLARDFTGTAVADAAARIEQHLNCAVEVVDDLEPNVLMQAASRAGVGRFITPYAPVGPVADRLRDAAETLQGEGKSLTRICRTWDRRFWPRANKGFFAFKESIPTMIAQELDSGP